MCDDQSKAFNKEIATGKVRLTPVTDSSYVLFILGVTKDSTGIWKVTYTMPHQNDIAVKQECR